MRCKSCGAARTVTKGPAHERICRDCAGMLCGAKVLAEVLYGRPFFWDGKSPITREDFLNDSIGRAWELNRQGIRFPGLLSFIQARTLGDKDLRP